MELVGELVAAAVVDARVWEAYGNKANDGVYLVGQPGPALPFVIFRAWKVPVGFVTEEVRLIGPSGRTIHRWGPEVRRMRGAMDLTVELDHVEDAVFDESGTYVASFILDDQIVGEIDFPVFVQTSADEAVEGDRGRAEEVRRDLGRRRAGRESGARRRCGSRTRTARSTWCRSGRRGRRSRPCPGVPDAQEMVVITRRKGRDTSLEEFTAAQRVLEGAEWEEAAKVLVDKRKSRGGARRRSRSSAGAGALDIVELTPNLPLLVRVALVRGAQVAPDRSTMTPSRPAGCHAANDSVTAINIVAPMTIRWSRTTESSSPATPVSPWRTV